MNHDCCSPTTSKGGKSMKKFDPFIVGIIGITVLILVVVIYFGSKMGATAQVTTDTQVTLAVDSNKYDWGTIDYDGGMATKTFTIKNTSNSVLKLYDVQTSCMCTTAQLKTPQITSQKFKMHEASADIIAVNPGETAELIVEFDPAFHGPSGVGPVTRIITMSTNDTKNSTLTFNLMGNVIKN